MLQTTNQENIVIIAGTLLVVLLGVFIISYVLVYQRRQARHRFETQQMQDKFQQELLNTQLEIQEQTLKNISQEIHDNIGQALTLAKLNLNTMLPIADEQLRQKILNSKELVSKAIGDLRSLSHSLDTDYVQEMGLQRAIEYELEMINKSSTIKTILEIQGTPYRLNKQKELILFRIVQESFNNIIKHADAKQIKVRVDYSPASLALEVVDDGKGIDLSQLSTVPSNFGLGIRNMHSRAQIIDAVFNISSELKAGTITRIFLPIKNHAHGSKQ